MERSGKKASSENARNFGGLYWMLHHVQLWRMHRLLGRFQTWNGFLRMWGKAQGRRRRPPVWISSQTLFESLPVSRVVADLREQGFYAGVTIPRSVVDELLAYARQSPCSRLGDSEHFRIDEVVNGRTPRGEVVAVADVSADACPAVGRIAGDAALTRIAATHLGYMPTRFAPRLYWSPAASLSNEQRRWNGQTIDYHYDIERHPTLYLYFYLSDTDVRSGAHVVVAGSHKSKPFRLKCGSTRQPEQVVLSYYENRDVVVFEGLAGFGFFEDPACFHKVLPPFVSDRLMLQLRYS